MEDMVAEQAHRRAGGGRRPRLSREQVLLSAMELADAEGIEALTMRNVAHRLGAEAMSLYRHVRDKDDILDAIIDRVYGEIALPHPGTDWQAAMRERAIATREVLARHRWAIGLMESRRRPGPANLRHHDAVVGFLTDAGFDARSATHAYNLLDSYIYGFVLQEQSLPFASPDDMAEFGNEMFDADAMAAYPHLARVSMELLASGFEYADEFEVGLDLVLDAITSLERGTAGRR